MREEGKLTGHFHCSIVVLLDMVFFRAVFLLLFQCLVLNSGTPVIIGHHYPPHKSLLTDKAALLAFRKCITHDPTSTLANWIEAVDVCNFTGVSCDRHRHRVSKLSLIDVKLVGKISPILSNLTGLRVLDIANNYFFGEIPSQLCSLRNLHRLRLDNNSLEGPIPTSLASLSKLTVISLMQNKLNGTVPPSLFSNCTSLLNVDLSINLLTGSIPEEVGNCPKLWNLNLYNNQFSGELPLSLTNTSLYNLDVEHNHLSGVLPAVLVGNLPSLSFLHLSNNYMVSHDGNTNLEPFIISLRNCSSLEELELAGMGLGGSLPDSIGQLGVNFSVLFLQENQIFGSIPPSLAKLSKLAGLNLTSNLLNGTIPAEISKLSKLEQLFLSHNLFTSDIPEALGELPHLGLLDLSHNQLSGEIPESFGNLTQMIYLFLNNNLLSGTIPSALVKCTGLQKLDLSFNMLSGSIPREISGLQEIRIFINLSHNNFQGNLPIELSKLKNVQEMDLSSNNLTGNIFPQISSCIALSFINFSNNFLQGHLPDSLGELANLESFDISKNQLSGMIPASLGKLQYLTYLNLSFNNFQGMIPREGFFISSTPLSFLNNTLLCGTIPGIPACSSKRNRFQSPVFLSVFILIICISSFFSTICCWFSCQHLNAIISARNSESSRRSKMPDFMHNFPRITSRQLSEATGGFDEQRLIGSGSYGRVYRGILSDGTTVAVKVLHTQSGNSTKSFHRECEVLKRIRHRNLIRIITACSLPDFKALVLPYMANGSLDSHLYPHSPASLASCSSDLNLIQRVNICSDIAEGMAYLHHHSPVRVIHCDLKPSNVLLKDDMTALVSDFGISRLMTPGIGSGAAAENMGKSTANMLTGSIGYIAPEYGFGSTASMKGDVYSFGVLVLEMVTRKRPIDDMFDEGLSLHKWVKSHYYGRVEKVVDCSLQRVSRDESPEVKKMWEVAIRELIELGLLCTQESPSTRPTMLDAAYDLDRLKRYLNGGDTTTTFASSLGISSSTLDDDSNYSPQIAAERNM
ncbi:putative leucine-rich repeat receptor-like serine/threonine-protein kinase At2g24130 isoform X1 [Cucurbita maxima]|uniref:non-specific serine/threonine protein kinase n=1 Tax=Cucurbita maxima TaxID=3661 RepID=A0A6J1J552_CUCMA|nr:putative leucine-rich repeat receptor-like serine/threonine-protein kinase At2g24130 isoform X1 [Cucurbita maxima]